MRSEIRAIQRRLGLTMVFVTHDQTEAMSMADRVILMRQGKIEQCGTPFELDQRPASTFVARFIGTPPMTSSMGARRFRRRRRARARGRSACAGTHPVRRFRASPSPSKTPSISAPLRRGIVVSAINESSCARQAGRRSARAMQRASPGRTRRRTFSTRPAERGESRHSSPARTTRSRARQGGRNGFNRQALPRRRR